MRRADKFSTRPVGLGYRVGENGIKFNIQDDELKKNMKFTVKMIERQRRVMSVSMGPIMVGASRPKPDCNDTFSMIVGAMKRLGRAPPPRHDRFMKALIATTQVFLRENVCPADPATDVSVDTWLARTHYTESRKRDLKREHEETSDLFDGKCGQCKGFGKDESYGEFKTPRMICSRTDAFKTFFGPFVKIAEMIVYSLPFFAKHLTPDQKVERLDRILSRAACRVHVLDYTAYESHFTPDVMAICEFSLLCWIFQFVPGFHLLMAMCVFIIGRQNVIKLVGFTFRVFARMSGEMDTSLGNGFTNLMIILTICRMSGNSDVDCMVEGDDCVVSMRGPGITAEMFKFAGWHVKLETYDNAMEAGFCGMIYDEFDKAVITDPIKMLLNFGWASAQYRNASERTMMALIRVKALSFLYQYPSCPIITKLAEHYLMLTNKITFYTMFKVMSKSHVSEYQREIWARVSRNRPTARPIGYNTRCLMERKFGIPVEVQVSVERQIESWGFEPVDIPVELIPHIHVDCFKYYEMYVTTSGMADTVSYYRDDVFRRRIYELLGVRLHFVTCGPKTHTGNRTEPEAEMSSYERLVALNAVSGETVRVVSQSETKRDTPPDFESRCGHHDGRPAIHLKNIKYGKIKSKI